jgi:hypothetical protein
MAGIATMDIITQNYKGMQATTYCQEALGEPGTIRGPAPLFRKHGHFTYYLVPLKNFPDFPGETQANASNYFMKDRKNIVLTQISVIIVQFDH